VDFEDALGGVGDGVEGADEAGEQGGEGGIVLTRPNTGAAGIGRCGRSEDGKGR
jgi:hypothetical protein